MQRNATAATSAIPPLDRTPSGHLPAVVQAALVDPPTGPCPVFRDCTSAEPGHFDHFSRLEVADDADGSTVLDAGMTALSGDDHHAIVYVRNAEFVDAASVHAATAKLRQLLDEVDRMAVRVFADHEARG